MTNIETAVETAVFDNFRTTDFCDVTTATTERCTTQEFIDSLVTAGVTITQIGKNLLIKLTGSEMILENCVIDEQNKITGGDTVHRLLLTQLTNHCGEVCDTFDIDEGFPCLCRFFD